MAHRTENNQHFENMGSLGFPHMHLDVKGHGVLSVMAQTASVPSSSQESLPEGSLPPQLMHQGGRLGGRLDGSHWQGKQAPLPPQPFSPGHKATCLCTALFTGITWKTQLMTSKVTL